MGIQHYSLAEMKKKWHGLYKYVFNKILYISQSMLLI